MDVTDSSWMACTTSKTVIAFSRDSAWLDSRCPAIGRSINFAVGADVAKLRHNKGCVPSAVFTAPGNNSPGMDKASLNRGPRLVANLIVSSAGCMLRVTSGSASRKTSSGARSRCRSAWVMFHPTADAGVSRARDVSSKYAALTIKTQHAFSAPWQRAESISLDALYRDVLPWPSGFFV